MSGEYTCSSYRLQGLVKVHVLLLHQAKESFHCHECGMALIHMTDRRRLAQLPQHAYSTHTKHYLLLEPCLNAASIQVRCDLPVMS